MHCVHPGEVLTQVGPHDLGPFRPNLSYKLRGCESEGFPVDTCIYNLYYIYILVGGLEHFFPYNGNNHPN